MHALKSWANEGNWGLNPFIVIQALFHSVPNIHFSPYIYIHVQNLPSNSQLHGLMGYTRFRELLLVVLTTEIHSLGTQAHVVMTQRMITPTVGGLRMLQMI